MDSMDDIIVLNVGGKVFCTSLESLSRLPETKLGRMARGGLLLSSKEIFFDRNPKVMHGILDLYRTGELHLPSNLCSNLIRKELEFWEVPEDLVSECCWQTYQSSKASKRIIDHIDHSLRDPYGLAHQDVRNQPLATRIWLSLDRPQHSFRAKMWNLTYVMFMMLSIIIFALETVDAFRGRLHAGHSDNSSCLTPEERQLFSEPLKALHYLDITCNIFFTLEPLVRLLTCPNKFIFLTTPLNIIDLVLIVSMWVGLALEDLIVPSIREASHSHVYLILTMRAVLALRVVRVLHLTKRFESMKVMMLSMKASSQELGLLMAVLFMAVLVYGNLVYIAEFISGTHVFQNVPSAVWWALITLTTVGYGDYYPTSVAGYFIGSACAITGLLLLAMPIAVIATNFSSYYENLDSYEQRRKRSAFIKDVLGRDDLFVQPAARSTGDLLHNCLEFSCCVAHGEDSMTTVTVTPTEEKSSYEMSPGQDGGDGGSGSGCGGGGGGEECIMEDGDRHFSTDVLKNRGTTSQ
ncbi:potassium voltage-gated channel protein Shaw-like [Littorina saxatilis]|uniref:potassium voltage-gated channel protein Shaw-like n=1 Tax=Littorina saxatilis TaxID=31220 RepID=UPI0038B5847A